MNILLGIVTLVLVLPSVGCTLTRQVVGPASPAVRVRSVELARQGEAAILLITARDESKCYTYKLPLDARLRPPAPLTVAEWAGLSLEELRAASLSERVYARVRDVKRQTASRVRLVDAQSAFATLPTRCEFYTLPGDVLAIFYEENPSPKSHAEYLPKQVVLLPLKLPRPLPDRVRATLIAVPLAPLAAAADTALFAAFGLPAAVFYTSIGEPELLRFSYSERRPDPLFPEQVKP